ncbi:hypothetical protein ACFLWC_04235 [Chloroflexota bacterium]
MRFLKNLAVSLLSFLLFLSLSTFGLVLTLNHTVLNPRFITSELDRLDVSSLAKEVLSEQASQEEMEATLVNTIAKLEPLVKEQVAATTYSIYDYLLGKRQNPELVLTLKNTFFNTDFVASVVDELDISSLAVGFFKQKLAEEIPEEFMKYVAEYLDDAITEAEPLIKEEMIAASGPVFDYLLGERQDLNVVISLEQITQTLRDNLREAFLQSPPPELAGVSPAMLEMAFNEFYSQAAGQIPSTFEINESLLGTEIPTNIATVLTQAEEALAQAKEYVGYFQLGYKLLIGFIVLLILGIILIIHEVKRATRTLGSTFVTFGAFNYASVLVAKYLARTQLQLPEIPASLQTWIPQFLGNLLAPMEMLSLGLLIGGIVLIIVCIFYKRRQPQPEPE